MKSEHHHKQLIKITGETLKLFDIEPSESTIKLLIDKVIHWIVEYEQYKKSIMKVVEDLLTKVYSELPKTIKDEIDKKIDLKMKRDKQNG
jgi:hypothetical protein